MDSGPPDMYHHGMDFNEMLSYMTPSSRGLGCSLDDAEALCDLGVSGPLAGIWMGTKARKASTLVQLLRAGHTLSDILDVESALPKGIWGDDALVEALGFGVTAERAQEFSELFDPEERTMENLVVFMHADLPREYAVSLV